MIGQSLEGDGINPNAAQNEALQKAAQQLSGSYRAAIKAPCDKAQTSFDAITENARRRDIATDKAIDQAIETAGKAK